MNTQNALEYYTKRKSPDYDRISSLATTLAEEGIVLLENRNGALPFRADEKVACFGRMQKHYMISGSGSGGSVSPYTRTNLFDSLKAQGLPLDEEIEKYYDDFVTENPYDPNGGWLFLPSQKEPLLEESFVQKAASRAETALFIVTRSAGEGHDMIGGRGGYLPTETDLSNLQLLRKYFKKLVLVLNTSALVDYTEFLTMNPDALVEVWTGGMMGGLAAANVLLGKTCPSGRLPATAPVKREDYPSTESFGDAFRSVYEEDIYVGYRWFETFEKEKVRYPFGYGLSYTTFSLDCAPLNRVKSKTEISVTVKNTGNVAGKMSVLCFVSAPQGRLGKPERSLCDFAKTSCLAPGASETLHFQIKDKTIASYDELSSSYLLEPGEYTFYVGGDVREVQPIGNFTLASTELVFKTESAMAPIESFKRIVNRGGVPVKEDVPLRGNYSDPEPEELPRMAKGRHKLSDVAEGKISLDDFVSMLSDEDLSCIVLGEGMSSPKAVPGTGAAFGGLTPSLADLGIPVVSCTDGPSGIRLVDGKDYASMPSGIAQASSFNTELISELYHECGNELAYAGVDLLLGPGTNIHRDILCGRNFEYFSEDPLLAGRCAAAVANGLDSAGVSATVKHFVANNQEVNRHHSESLLSERALREIYAKPFEICVTESPIRAVMTSYNRVNGRWTASSYDLTTRLLRNEWGFTGFVMTDWWAQISDKDGREIAGGYSHMIHAQNDIFMVLSDAQSAPSDLKEALAQGGATRAELQRSAKNLLRFILESVTFAAYRLGCSRVQMITQSTEGDTVASLDVTDGNALVTLKEGAQCLMRITYTANLAPLEQIPIVLHLNGGRVCSIVVSRTGEEDGTETRAVSLRAGDNKFCFTSPSEQVAVKHIELILPKQ